MKEKIKAFFTTNIGLKLGALVSGIVVWGMLFNVQDPTVTKTISIPVTYVNSELLKKNDEIVFLSGPQKTDIEVTTRTSRAGEVTAEMFECLADLTMRSGGALEKQSVRVEVRQTGGEDLILEWNYLRNDPYITVSMDQYVSKDFPVNMLWTDVVNDLKPEEVTFSPSVVTIYGPSSAFSNLASVSVPMTLGDLTKGQGGEFRLDVEPRLYDLNGKELTNMKDFDIDSPKISMTARISNMKKVALEMTGAPTGKVKDGVSFVKATAEESAITLFSLQPIALEKLEIPLSDLDITGLAESKVMKLDLTAYLPEGVHLSDNERFLAVSVEVEAHGTKLVVFPNVGLTGTHSDYEYTFTTEPSVSCTAAKEILDTLNAAAFEPSLNVENLEPGKHTVKVKVRHPENVRVNESGLTVEIEVKEKGTKTPDESTSEESGSSEEN